MIPDARHIANGREIPSEGYCDQPYIVKTDDGAWLCVMTTGKGHEGQSRQHIIALRSADQGKTWAEPVDVEPADGPESSYAVLLKTGSGRIYCFYNHNTDNRRWVIADNPPYKDGKCYRVDSQGYFVFKFSDDHGRTWSSKRYPIPMREMAIDRDNPYQGAVRFFWKVGKPFVLNGAACVSLHKVGGIGHGFFTRSEGTLLRSDNLLTETNPERIRWETLPDGDAGLRTPPGGGPIAEEQSYSVLSDQTIYCVYRSIDGHPVCSYSRDAGRSWSVPAYKRYADGRMMKHPRAANFAWKCSNGHYLYWFHNHGGAWYDDRNPVWLCGGVEADSEEGKIIRWSQPEILLYDDDPYVRISYPDLIEDGGQYFISETQKETARAHEIDAQLLDGLWNQDRTSAIASEGLALDTTESVAMRELPPFLKRDYSRLDGGRADLRSGFSIDLYIRFDELTAGQTLLDNRAADGRGFCARTTGRETVEIILNDGRSENRWESDSGLFSVGVESHIGIIVDGGPRIILFVIDGKLCDGGTDRQFGWGRFSPNLIDVRGSDTLRIGPDIKGEIRRLRLYNRPLRVSEIIGNQRAERQAEDERRLRQLEEWAEAAYEEMYEASGASGYYSEAKENLYEAIRLAGRMGRMEDRERLEKRLEHIKAVFRSQMSS